MKKVTLLLIACLMLGSTAAVACETRTYIIGGKIVICTVCPYVTTCNQGESWKDTKVTTDMTTTSHVH